MVRLLTEVKSKFVKKMSLNISLFLKTLRESNVIERCKTVTERRDDNKKRKISYLITPKKSYIFPYIGNSMYTYIFFLSEKTRTINVQWKCIRFF